MVIVPDISLINSAPGYHLPQFKQSRIFIVIAVKEYHVTPWLIVSQCSCSGLCQRRTAGIQRLWRIKDFLVIAVILYLNRKRQLYIEGISRCSVI